MVTRPSPIVGAAISPSELCVAFVDASGARVVRRTPIDAFNPDVGAWPSLAAALAELRGIIGTLALAVSLMPPLTEVRVVELPPVREDEAERVLARGAGKYFVTARQAQLVAVAPRPRRSGSARSASPVVAAAAPARLIAAVLAAARDATLTIERIGPAESAWAAAAADTLPHFARGAAAVLLLHPGRVELLGLADGALRSVRRFRAAASDVERIADAVRAIAPQDAARVGVLGDPAEREAIVRRLGELGLPVSAPASRAPGDALPDVLAAAFAAPMSGPLFRTEDARLRHRREAGRAAAAIAAAALLLVLAGGGLQLWGVHRHLDATRAERARLSPRLSSTLIGRTSAELVARQLATLDSAERRTIPWSATLVQLSAALPGDAYLTALRTRDDSLVVDGLSEHAAEAFDAIAAMRGLAEVRSAAPVRRELQGDTAAREHFTIAARVVTR